jgi:hypothetical protein
MPLDLVHPALLAAKMRAIESLGLRHRLTAAPRLAAHLVAAIRRRMARGRSASGSLASRSR